MKRKLLVLALVLVWTGSVFGSTMRFSRRTDWGTIGNWNVLVNGSWISATALPTTADELTYLASPTIASGTAAYAGISSVGGGRTITINGSYTSGNRMSIGFDTVGSGTVTVNAGATLDNKNGITGSGSGELKVGDGGIGVLNVYGTVLSKTSVDVGCNGPGSDGTLNIFSTGVVDINGVDSRLTVGEWGATAGSIVIHEGGTLHVRDNYAGALRGYVDSGKISAALPNQTIKITWNSSVGLPGAGATFTVITKTTTSDPYPAISEIITSTTPTLSWDGGNASSYDVYFGTDLNKMLTVRRLAGDFNNDRVVDMVDLSSFAQQWLTAPAAGIFSADFDASGNVDTNDFARLAGNWQAAADAEYMGNQAEPNYAILSPLTVGPTYYWKVDAVDANNQVHAGEVWRFGCGTKHMTELLKDPYFQHGLQVYSPQPSIPEGVLKWNDTWELPDWDYAQVFGEDLNGAVAQLLPSGSYKFENTHRSVVMGPMNSTDADIMTMIDTRGEIINDYQWPGLDISQVLVSRSPWLTDMSELRFNVDVRLRDLQQFEPPETRGVTLFKVGFVVQDVNAASPGHGSMVYGAVAIYKSNLGIWNVDECGTALGAFFYNLSSTRFTDPTINPDPNADLMAGEWVTFKADLLPIIDEILQTAWDWGLLPNSRHRSNFKITIFGPGWESGERIKCEMQLRNLSLKAVDGNRPPQPANTKLFLTAVGDDWGTLDNWKYADGVMKFATSLPTLTNDVVLLVANPTIASGTASQAKLCEVGINYWGATPINLTINGSLTTGGALYIANGAGSTGTVTVNAGAVLDTGINNLYVGDSGGLGVLNVSGTVSTGGLNIGSLGIIIVSPGGSFSTASTSQATLQAWINSGAIRAADGATLVVTWVGGGATFTATP